MDDSPIDEQSIKIENTDTIFNEDAIILFLSKQRLFKLVFHILLSIQQSIKNTSVRMPMSVKQKGKELVNALPNLQCLLFFLFLLFIRKRTKMIEGYNYETAPLNEYERETLLPIFVKCLQRKIGRENAITNRMMCTKMEEYGYKVGETRIRKIINHIRINNLISCLVASGNGYYVADNQKDIKEHIRSLKGRVAAILAVIEALQEQAGLSDYDCYLDDE